MDNKYNLFLISEALKGKIKRPIQTFIEKDYKAAKLYFQAWIECDWGLKNAHYLLHKIGEFDMNERKLKPCMIYIADEITCKVLDNGNKPDQLTLELAKNYSRACTIWQKNITYNEKLKEYFEGKEI